MANNTKSRSYVVRLLRILNAAALPMTSEQVWIQLGTELGPLELERWQKARSSNVHNTIRELQGLGIVRSVGAEDGPWVLGGRPLGSGGVDGQGPAESPPMDAGRRNGGGGGGGASDGDGQGEGGGLGEVLNHPVLFCLDEFAFEAAVDSCLIIHEA